MKHTLFMAAVVALLCGAAACSEDKPSCTASEGEGCLNTYDACMWNIDHDTEVDTESDTVIDTDTSAGSAAETACHDDYCACLAATDCQASTCQDTDTGTGI